MPSRVDGREIYKIAMLPGKKKHSIPGSLFSGSIRRAAGLIVGHPFDTTKVQLQTSQLSSPYAGTMDAVRHIAKQGLARGLFRGMGFPLASYGVVNSVYFGVYGNAIRLIGGDQEIKKKPSYLQVSLAGAMGGAAQLFVACPVDVAKVVLQSQIPKETAMKGPSQLYFRGPMQCLGFLYRRSGIRGCYKGFTIQALRDIPSSSVYFFMYESLFDQLWGRGYTDSNGIFASMVAGGFAGVFSWVSIIPLDVIKSHIQADITGTKYSGIRDCAQKLYQQQGWRVFFTGVVVMSIRAFPANAVIFTVHQQCMNLLKKRNTLEQSNSTTIDVGSV